MIVAHVLKRTANGRGFFCNGPDLELCEGPLRRLWNLPKGVGQILVVASDEPLAGARPIRMLLHKNHGSEHYWTSSRRNVPRGKFVDGMDTYLGETFGTPGKETRLTLWVRIEPLDPLPKKESTFSAHLRAMTQSIG